MPSKTIRLGGKTRVVQGLSDQDDYFQSVSDDMESEFADVCRICVPPDAVCLDIGANIGIKSLTLSDLAAKGRVFAFEPAPSIYPVLVANLRENGCDNVVTRQVAISTADGPVSFHDNSVYGHLLASGGTTVPGMRLGTAIDSLHLDRIDFIKMDIEGFEPKVLQADYDTLCRFNPILMFEFNTWCMLSWSRTDPVDFLEWLFDHFELVARVNRRPAGRLLEPLAKEDLRKFLYHNLIEERCVSDLIVSAKANPRWPDEPHVDLKAYHVHANAEAAPAEQGLSFTTPQGLWHYAVSLSCGYIPISGVLEIEVETSHGAVGFGLTDTGYAHYVSDEITVSAGDGRKRIRIVMKETRSRAILVIRNTSPDGASRGVIVSAAGLRDPASG